MLSIVSIREPLSRALSAFRYGHGGGHRVWQNYVDDGHRQNVVTRQLCGEPHVCEAPPSTDSTLAAAVENLRRFDAIVMMEDWDASILSLARVLPGSWTPRPAVRERSNYDAEHFVPDGAQRRHFRLVNQHDLILYAHAVLLFCAQPGIDATVAPNSCDAHMMIWARASIEKVDHIIGQPPE
jgi:hypothetical protein